MARKRGGQSTYTHEVGDRICEELAAGRSLLNITSTDPNMPPNSTVTQWVLDDAGPGFAAKYARARDRGLDVQVDEMLEVARDKNRDPKCRQVEIDALKWRLCKMAPKRYGDRLELAGDKEAPLTMVVTRLDRPPKGNA